MKSNKFILLILVIFLSCKENVKILTAKKPVYKDSTLTIFDFAANEQPGHWNPEKAKSTLDDHFKKKGYLIESELDFETFLTEAEQDHAKKAIDFLEIKPIKSSAAIIKYYNCDPFENGSCVLPHYAVIANTIAGNKIIHEDFLPNDFMTDSIANINKQVFIYGYFYECANKKKLQQYKIALK